MYSALLAILVIAGTIGDLSHEENSHLDKLVDQNIVFEFDEINSENISGVVDASFVGVKVFQLFDKDCSAKEECGYTEHKILKHGDTLIELTAPDVLLPYIAPGFVITKKAEAKEFEKMLDVVFPTFFSSGKEIYPAGDTWVFIREESFGEKKGVIVTVNNDGVIQKIREEDEVVK